MAGYIFPSSPKENSNLGSSLPEDGTSGSSESQQGQSDTMSKHLPSGSSSEEFIYSRQPGDLRSETYYSSKQSQSDSTPQRIEQNVATDDPNLPLPGERTDRKNSGPSQLVATGDPVEDYPTLEEEKQREDDAVSSGASMSVGADYGDDDNPSTLSSPHYKYRTSTAAEAMRTHIETSRKKAQQEDTDDDASTAKQTSSQIASETTLPKYPAFSLKETSDGFYIQVGKDKLQRCEDEPIATPGTIQNFGCLLVIEHGDSNVKVVQASENVNKHLGGLSVRDLFQLDSFMEVLQDDGAAKLYDVLYELDEETDLLHTFPLSGRGKKEDDGWYCWCAAHLANNTAPVNDMNNEIGNISSESKRPRIILEFEPIHDIAAKEQISRTSIPRIYEDIHPLYPINDIQEECKSTGDTVKNMSDISKTITKTDSTNETVKPVDNSQEITTVKSADKDETNEDYNDEPYWSLGQDSFATLHEIRRSTISKSRPLRVLQRSARTQKAFDTKLQEERNKLENSGELESTLKKEELNRNHLQAKIRRHINNPDGISSLDVITLCQDIDAQLSEAAEKSVEDLYDVIVGIAKDITNFDRALLYKFDDEANGVVVSELMDWQRCKEIFHGLHFPASDIPAQARKLYVDTKVRQLYDRDAPTSQVVVRDKEDLKYPLDMSGCSLRAMSPIHIKYLKNMNVRSSLSISIITQTSKGKSLYGLVSCHSFESEMRVSFPQIQMLKHLKMFSDIASRNIDTAIYKSRLRGRELMLKPTDIGSGSISSDSNIDLLRLFDSNHLLVCYNDRMKIFGDEQHHDIIKYVGQYLQNMKFKDIHYTTKMDRDFPEMKLGKSHELSGLLYIPLGNSEKESSNEHFMAFFRYGQLSKISWAGNPSEKTTGSAPLQPRSSFKKWTESVTSTSKDWQLDELESASVLSTVYSKILGQNRKSTKSKISDLLVSNVDKDFEHELRTPLHHFCSYLDMALERKDGVFDKETRKHLKKSKSSAQNMLYAVNDLISLTTQSEEVAALKAPLNFISDLLSCVESFKQELISRKISIEVDTAEMNHPFIVSDSRKIRLIIKNLLENAIKYNHEKGKVFIKASSLSENSSDPEGTSAIVLKIEDTGSGISHRRLQDMFASFEKLENISGTDSDLTTSSVPEGSDNGSFGKGLIQVARSVSQLQAKMTCSSHRGKYTRWQITLPLSHASESDIEDLNGTNSFSISDESSSKHTGNAPIMHRNQQHHEENNSTLDSSQVEGARVKDYAPDLAQDIKDNLTIEKETTRLIACDDDPINNRIIKRRLKDIDVVLTANGQEAIDKLLEGEKFDLLLLDLMMPVCDGHECVKRIREYEQEGRSFKSNKEKRRLLVFAFSASITPTDLDKLKSQGFDGFFLKPLHFATLNSIIESISNDEDLDKFKYKDGKRFEKGGLID
ncbi:hypothetical protein E3Q15_03596 [Wallemia mellicola]|nr:hypothetical protein E3Q15_03596 [Wallemia mellicola]TIC50493.1 hypothetical protein E3Q05_03444 [Wallemia mellicola]